MNSSQKSLDSEIIKELMVIKHRYLLKIPFLLFLYIFAVSITIYFQQIFGIYGYFASLPLYLLAGASLHGICLFTHEGVHGTLHTNKWINDFIGSLTGYIVLQTMAGYRVLHLKHHKYLNIEGDPGLLKTYFKSNKYTQCTDCFNFIILHRICLCKVNKQNKELKQTNILTKYTK